MENPNCGCGDNLDEANSSNLEETNSSNLENPNGGDNLEEANSSNLENPNDNLEGVLERWKTLKQELGLEIESEIDMAIWWASFVAGWEEEVELREKEIEDRNRALTRSEADLRLREEALRRREQIFLHAKALKLEERPEPTYDVRTRPNLIEISSLSKDLQKVKIGLCVLARPGENFDERALLLIFNETTKTVVSQYNASQILTTERETVIKEIKDKLTERAMNFKIVLDDVSITLSLLAAVGPEYTLFVDEKIEKDNTSAIIRAQDGVVEQTKEDMQQREELEKWERKLEQWEGKLEHREEDVEQREEDVEQREEAALQRDKRQYDRWLRLMEWESDLRRTHYAVEQGHARLSNWVKEAQLEQANREGKVRTGGDEMTCEKLRLQAKEEVEDNDKRKNDEEKEEVKENEKEKKELTRGCFGTEWPCYFGLRAAGSSDAWESLKIYLHPSSPASCLLRRTHPNQWHKKLIKTREGQLSRHKKLSMTREGKLSRHKKMIRSGTNVKLATFSI